MVLLSHQLPCILAGFFSAAVVFTAPIGPLPGDANPFALGLAVYRPDDGGSGTDAPDPEPSVPSDSESYPSSTYRVTEKENGPSNKKEETASTKKHNDTPTSDEEDASTSVLARMPATFGAAIAVIAWMYV
ncbi:hypothetical protein FALCPG4_007690 [Fusarium falciforme]